LVWLILFALGCYHGINPGMGWLFAVALGLQERRTSAVLSAIVPIAIGHVASVAIIVMLALFAAARFPHTIVHVTAAVLLIGFGVYRLSRGRHVRWVGMRVGFWGLLLWGFLMSTAHGAGLMLIPFVTAASPAMRANTMQMPMPAVHALSPAVGWLMIGVHTLGYLLTMTAIALLVYLKFGLSFLRTAWFNVDATWAAALIVTGLIALFT
jgi:hypothetical protein